MEIKLFGKSLFGFRKGNVPMGLGFNAIAESKFLIDFHKDTGGESSSIGNWAVVQSLTTGAVAVAPTNEVKKEEVNKPDKPTKTPKEVYNLKMLNDKSFKMKTDPKFIDEQLESFKEKLGMIKTEEYDMGRGTYEIASIVQRLENRKKYATVKEIFDEFPYTTTTLINGVIKEHDNLKLGQVAQFLADMPKEATNTMKRYNEGCKKLCDKQAVFYIIADKKDFQKSDKRRDPILLAQSPFGHFWQILGAWDEEMMFLEEL